MRHCTEEAANIVAEAGVTVKKIILAECYFQSAEVKVMKEKHERDLGMKKQSHKLKSSAMQEDLSIMKLWTKECGGHLEVAVPNNKRRKKDHHAIVNI